MRAIALLPVLAATLVACAPIRSDFRAEPSYSFDRPRETTLGRASAVAEAAHPGLSGFRLLNNGSSALVTRGVLADLAERTLDLQYFIYDADHVGAFIADRLIAAADRGVRVRMIVDDYQLGARDDTLAHLDEHPNIEVRVFNPYPDRARWSRPLQMLFNLDTLGKRMHNKVYAVDGHAAILGGRNLSNHYFEAEGETNFRDVDVLAVGPVVKDVQRQFDSYWNSPMVVPVAAFGLSPPSGRRKGLPEELHPFVGEQSGPFAEYLRRKDEVRSRLLTPDSGFIWARSTAVAEPPLRQAEGAEKASNEVARTLAIQRQAVKNHYIMETAYFVPGERGVTLLDEIVKRGARVQILTNSLATTDVPAVHAGYARYREALVASGIELHQYRGDSARPVPSGSRMRLGSSASALHTKVIVHDGRMVWIGSANFDPRSRRLNTETGLLIDSEALATQVLASFRQDFSARQSWKLVLEGEPRRLVWVGEENGRLVRHESEPRASFLRQLGVLFFSILPIEDLL